MGLNFNLLLTEAGIEPRDVRLMRHQQSSKTGLTPYSIWRDDPAEFERYQSAQRADRRAHFASRFWAGFVATPDGSTLFVGLFEIDGYDTASQDWVDPLHRQTVLEMRRDLDIYRYRRKPEGNAPGRGVGSAPG
ncbi:hypothetical protein BH10PSE15_BH10PSE15_04120 [soil metagenome]